MALLWRGAPSGLSVAWCGALGGALCRTSCGACAVGSCRALGGGPCGALVRWPCAVALCGGVGPRLRRPRQDASAGPRINRSASAAGPARRGLWASAGFVQFPSRPRHGLPAHVAGCPPGPPTGCAAAPCAGQGPGNPWWVRGHHPAAPLCVAGCLLGARPGRPAAPGAGGSPRTESRVAARTVIPLQRCTNRRPRSAWRPDAVPAGAETWLCPAPGTGPTDGCGAIIPLHRPVASEGWEHDTVPGADTWLYPAPGTAAAQTPGGCGSITPPRRCSCPRRGGPSPGPPNGVPGPARCRAAPPPPLVAARGHHPAAQPPRVAWAWPAARGESEGPGAGRGPAQTPRPWAVNLLPRRLGAASYPRGVRLGRQGAGPGLARTPRSLWGHQPAALEGPSCPPEVRPGRSAPRRNPLGAGGGSGTDSRMVVGTLPLPCPALPGPRARAAETVSGRARRRVPRRPSVAAGPSPHGTACMASPGGRRGRSLTRSRRSPAGSAWGFARSLPGGCGATIVLHRCCGPGVAGHLPGVRPCRVADARHTLPGSLRVHRPAAPLSVASARPVTSGVRPCPVAGARYSLGGAKVHHPAAARGLGSDGCSLGARPGAPSRAGERGAAPRNTESRGAAGPSARCSAVPTGGVSGQGRRVQSLRGR
ncbi:hypothetical protein OV450_6638 [Actinobacteria bacterium OV450]|nr:hypothetical protein OV450_6638 [Actinobacteria bacterium OV450]